jgi:outer membrane protein assembly factor BamA
MNSIIGLTLVHDNTNDFFNPSAGFYHSITAENAGLFPRFMNLINRNIDFSQYVKFYTINKFYYDISGRRATSIFAFYNEIGDIIEYGKGDYIVPVAPLYKFISGGSSSLRGWNAKEGGILRTPEDGGKFLFEGSFEYRWRSFSRNQNFLKNIWTVYFIDYGNVWERHKLFKLSEIALAIGIGIRYETFIGPLRVDFGFKLYNPTAKENNKWLFDNFSRLFKDRKFAFQFGLGNAF